jgi:hypothetical protein
VAAPVPGVAGALTSDRPRRGLTLRAAVRLKADAVPLERQDDRVAAVARRVGSGRVVLLGYVDTWRWRMLGGDGGPAAHRAWWSRVVSSVAYAPRLARDGVTTSGAALPAADSLPDAAPYAHAVAALGAPLASSPVAAAAEARELPWWIFVLVAGALLAEWASRRLRGAR